MMRILLFLITNLSVMLVFGIILSWTGMKSNSIHGMIILSGLFGFGGAFISLLISKWIALYSVGGQIIKQPHNETEHWLLQTVKYQAQKTGIRVPQVAIYHSPDINAFATGARRNSSLIAVSTGLLQSMNRDEAEAVVAHEISHISNGDMVTMTLIQGIVNTFVIFISRILAQLVSLFLSGNRTNEESTHGNPLVYFVMVTILELVFGIIASIITMWFSRYREFYADAGSANLVGREKMISALERLKHSHSSHQEPSSIQVLCINGKSKSFIELFMSHPPLDKRIEALHYGTYVK